MSGQPSKSKDFDRVKTLWPQAKLSETLIKYLTKLGVEPL